LISIVIIIIIINNNKLVAKLCKQGNCYAAFTGVYCETEYDPCAIEGANKCSNSSLLVECRRNASNIQHGHSCLCPLGYVSQLNEQSMFTCQNANECSMKEMNKCENNSTCIDTPGSYACICLRGFTGDRCQIKLNAALSSGAIGSDIENPSHWSEWTSWSKCVKSKSNCDANSQRYQYSNRTCVKKANYAERCTGVYERKRKCPESETACSTRLEVYYDYLIFHDQLLKTP
jgi:hypothetical protein